MNNSVSLSKLNKYCFVSVIIPTKNEENRINGCIESIYAIDYPKEFYEVIIVDNGSSDMTVNIAQNKGAKVLISRESTISGLRNIGANNARGDIIAFLDADCIVTEGWIKFAIDTLNDKSVVACGALPIVENNATWVQEAWEFAYKNRKKKAIVNWLSSMNLFVKKSAFLIVNGFDESLSTCEDVDLCYRLNRIGQIVADKRITVIHLGEPKTVKDFFRRELWHGQSNFKGFIKHGIVINEIPSLLAPLYFIFISMMLMLSLVQYKLMSSITYAILFLLPPFLLAIKKSINGNKFKFLLKLMVLYTTYFVARSLSLFINYNKRAKD